MVRPLEKKGVDLRDTLVCEVDMTMYFYWTCLNINRKDVHAGMNLIYGKDIY